MPAECGNDNDDGNSHDEDVDTTDFITAWKIYFYFFKIGAEGRRIRAEGCGSRKTKSRNWRKVHHDINKLYCTIGVIKKNISHSFQGKP